MPAPDDGHLRNPRANNNCRHYSCQDVVDVCASQAPQIAALEDQLKWYFTARWKESAPLIQELKAEVERLKDLLTPAPIPTCRGR